MGNLIQVLAGCKGKLEKAKWACEFEGKEWKVDSCDIDVTAKAMTVEYKISNDGVKHDVKLIEHHEGGGDKLKIDGKEYDADHHVSVKVAIPKLKFKVKSEYSTDPDPEFEKLIRFSCKITPI